jgi:hypothetical protein
VYTLDVFIGSIPSAEYYDKETESCGQITKDSQSNSQEQSQKG